MSIVGNIEKQSRSFQAPFGALFFASLRRMENLRLSDYHYDLPDSRIPAFPLENRDEARLLVYESGAICHRVFHELPEILPSGSLLVFNDTRVIPARLFFRRDSGARIEVLLLSPIGRDLQQALQSKDDSDWEAIIGGLKKWKEGEWIFIQLPGTLLRARLTDRSKGHVRLSWDSDDSLAEILDQAGKLPLPPYLKRENQESDKERYQTVYAQNEGAVAAPTAGLHFTPGVLDRLEAAGMDTCKLTLHVGAGTFKPVKVENPLEHDMHNERMWVSKTSIHQLIHKKGPCIAVGTTSMRTLESLYWWGVKLETDPEAPFFVGKLEPYSVRELPDTVTAFENILRYMDSNNLDHISGSTEILIVPGYRFHVCEGLITNFHLPETTLILLVAAFVGEDWRRIYNSALEQEYRFLSFGDSSLLLP